MVPLGGVKQAGLVLRVDGHDVGLVLEEGVDGGHVALLRRQEERRAVVEVPPLDVGAASKGAFTYDVYGGYGKGFPKGQQADDEVRGLFSLISYTIQVRNHKIFC